MNIKGEFYVAGSTGNIYMWGIDDSQYYLGGSRTHPNKYFRTGGGVFSRSGDRKATPEEKAWLMACIEAGKYIPLEELKLNDIYLIYP